MKESEVMPGTVWRDREGRYYRVEETEDDMQRGLLLILTVLLADGKTGRLQVRLKDFLKPSPDGRPKFERVEVPLDGLDRELDHDLERARMLQFVLVRLADLCGRYHASYSRAGILEQCATAEEIANLCRWLLDEHERFVTFPAHASAATLRRVFGRQTRMNTAVATTLSTTIRTLMDAQ